MICLLFIGCPPPARPAHMHLGDCCMPCQAPETIVHSVARSSVRHCDVRVTASRMASRSDGSSPSPNRAKNLSGCLRARKKTVEKLACGQGGARETQCGPVGTTPGGRRPTQKRASGSRASSMASGRHGSGAYHRRNSSCKARRASIPPLPSAPPARPAAPSVPPAAPSAPSVPEGRSRRRTSSGERTRGGCGLAGATTGHGTWAKRTLGLGLGSGFSLEFGVE